MSATPQIPPTGVTSIELTVRYAETDQMGIAYHANYLVWCDMARTALLRGHGLSYRHRADTPEEVDEIVGAALDAAFLGGQRVAVLLSQRLIGRKRWTGR